MNGPNSSARLSSSCCFSTSTATHRLDCFSSMMVSSCLASGLGCDSALSLYENIFAETHSTWNSSKLSSIETYHRKKVFNSYCIASVVSYCSTVIMIRIKWFYSREDLTRVLIMHVTQIVNVVFCT